MTSSHCCNHCQFLGHAHGWSLSCCRHDCAQLGWVPWLYEPEATPSELRSEVTSRSVKDFFGIWWNVFIPNTNQRAWAIQPRHDSVFRQRFQNAHPLRKNDGESKGAEIDDSGEPSPWRFWARGCTDTPARKEAEFGSQKASHFLPSKTPGQAEQGALFEQQSTMPSTWAVETFNFSVTLSSICLLLSLSLWSYDNLKTNQLMNHREPFYEASLTNSLPSFTVNITHQFAIHINRSSSRTITSMEHRFPPTINFPFQFVPELLFIWPSISTIINHHHLREVSSPPIYRF